MAPVLVTDVQPFPEQYEGDPRLHDQWIVIISEAVPAGYWITVGSAPNAEVAQVSTCERAASHYVCKLATRLASPHSAGEPVTVIPDLTD